MDADLNFGVTALLWGVGAHAIVGGVIGIIPKRPRTAYVVVQFVCVAEALLVAGGMTMFGGAFIAMAAHESEPLWSATGAMILALFAGFFLVSLIVQGLPMMAGAWLARKLLRRQQP